MNTIQTKIQENTYFRTMRLFQENLDLTQSELADKLCTYVCGLNYYLNTLIGMGFVKMETFHKNKFKCVYLLKPRDIVEKETLTSRFVKRKMEEYAAFKLGTEALKTESGEDHAYGMRKHAQ